MNIDKGLCCAIVAQKEIKSALDAGIQPEDLFSPWDGCFKQIVNHFLQHKVIPSKDAIFTDGSFEEPEDHIDHFVYEIRRRKIRNGLTSGIKDVMRLVVDENDPEQALRSMQQLGIDLEMRQMGGKGDIVNVFSDNAIAEFIERYEKRKAKAGPDGLLTFWPSFNIRSFGFQPEEVIVIVGKKKTKKTFLALGLTHHIWTQGVKPILVVSMEMSIAQMQQRLLAFHLRAPYDLLRKAQLPDLEEKTKLEQARALADGPGILVTDVKRVNSTYDLEVVCAQIKPKFVLVDGLYILQPRERGVSAQHEKVGSVIKDMCRIAGKYNLTILSTTQFNRKVKYGHMEATTDEIAASDAIGQFAHCCLGLFPSNKEEVHGPTALVRTLAAREFLPIDLLINYNLDTMDFSEIKVLEPDDDDDDDDDDHAPKKKSKKNDGMMAVKPPTDMIQSDDQDGIM